eukprot:SM000197S05440  [mRNA]  locus=s197:65384:66759:+ [translate_table: standard]
MISIHFHAHDLSKQVEHHMFCAHLNEDVSQCLLYDSNSSSARLVGMEYAVSDKLFKDFPPEEKKLWHSHIYEVKAGIAFLPGVPTTVELKELDRYAKTYGKGWQLWQFDEGDPLPVGVPDLLMAFTHDGQLLPEVRKAYENKHNISVEGLKKARGHIEGPSGGVDPLANSWETGKSIKVELKEVSLQAKHLT